MPGVMVQRNPTKTLLNSMEGVWFNARYQYVQAVEVLYAQLHDPCQQQQCDKGPTIQQLESALHNFSASCQLPKQAVSDQGQEVARQLTSSQLGSQKQAAAGNLLAVSHHQPLATQLPTSQLKPHVSVSLKRHFGLPEDVLGLGVHFRPYWAPH